MCLTNKIDVDNFDFKNGLVIIDNNIPKYIAYALNQINHCEDNEICFTTVTDAFYDGIADEDFLPKLKRGALIISADMFKNGKERQIIKDNQISYLYIHNKKGRLRALDILKVFIDNWDKLTKIKSYPIYYKFSSKTKKLEQFSI